MSTPAPPNTFKFLPQGALIQEFNVAGHNIVLGYPSPASYQHPAVPFFGETIGRVANRISAAQINNLNGRSYKLAANNGPNTLHGGAKGWGKQVFEGPTGVKREGRDALLFKYLSRDGDEGFPGAVEVRVWYFPETVREDGVEKTSLELEYEVEMVGDAAEGVEETAVSVTNHSYFNISNGPTIEGTRATLHTNSYQIVDDDSIPTGEIGRYPGINAGQEFILGAEDPDPDHCFIVDAKVDPSSIPLDTRKQPLKKLCEFYHPDTKLHLEALSSEPAFQFYAGRYIDVPELDGKPARGRRAGMCIEASRYINAANEDKWRSQVVVKRGKVWGSRTVYRAWKDDTINQR